MVKLIMALVQRLGMRGGMKKAAEMGINPRQYMEIVKRAKLSPGGGPRLPRGETSPMPGVVGRASGGARPGRIAELQGRKTFAQRKAARVAEPTTKQARENYNRRMQARDRRDEMLGETRVPMYGHWKLLQDQAKRKAAARAESGWRKQALIKHRAAMKKARELAKRARKAQTDARAHAEGMRLMDETYGAF